MIIAHGGHTGGWSLCVHKGQLKFAYNWFGRVIGRIEAELEGFAHDLLAVFGERPAAALPPAGAMLV